MFTGLVQAMAPVVAAETGSAGMRLTLDLGEIARDQALGASIAVAGCCLTVVRFDGSCALFELSPETLSKTRFAEIQAGDAVNIEAALRAGDPLGGHFVSGHVDGIGQFLSRHRDGDYEVQVYRAPEALGALLVPQGSITVEGVSLTLAALDPPCGFSVALIPETLARTTLGRLAEGAAVHMEGDLLGKFVHAYLERRDPGRNTKS